MGLWKPPAKVMLPSEFDDAASHAWSPALFEYNGHLPDGTQILAYLFSTPPGAAASRRDLAVVHEFDADGHHRLIRTRDIDESAAGMVFWQHLHELVAPYRVAGWRPSDIWVRPFLVEINGCSHGLVYEAEGDGLERECPEGCECGRDGLVSFRPFGFPFHPPYDAGSYDT